MSEDAKGDEWEKAGTIGVDAGLCWIGDPCYVLGDKASHRVRDFHAMLEDLFARQDRGATQFNYALGHAGLGVCVSTGFGDGTYDVFVRRVTTPEWGERIAEVKVVFIESDGESRL